MPTRHYITVTDDSAGLTLPRHILHLLLLRLLRPTLLSLSLLSPTLLSPTLLSLNLPLFALLRLTLLRLTLLQLLPAHCHVLLPVFGLAGLATVPARECGSNAGCRSKVSSA